MRRVEPGAKHAPGIGSLLVTVGLTLSGTASHLAQVLAGSPWTETADLQLGALGCVYLVGGLIGLGLGTAARLGARATGRAFDRAVVASLVVLNLWLALIVHVWGGREFGLFIVTAAASGTPGWLVLALLVALAAVLVGVLCRSRWGEQACLTLGGLIAASALLADLWNVGAFAASRPEIATPQVTSTSAESRESGPVIVHVVFDEMSSLLLQEHESFAKQAFFRVAPSGVFFRNAYTNSIATVRAIPQLVSGEFEAVDVWNRSVLAESRRAGYPLHLYLATAPLTCEPGRASSCQWFPTLWPREVFGGDQRAYLGYQLLKLVRIYLTRFLGPAIHELHAWGRQLQPADLALGGRPLSLLLFERFLEDLRANRGPGYYFLHLGIPHAPLVLDASCRVTGDLSGLSSYKIPSRDPAYLEQMHCANHLAIELIEELRRSGRYDQTALIIQSDHGPRGDLVKALRERGSSDGLATGADVAAIEQATRMMLWIKPPGHTQSSESEELVQLVEMADRIRALAGLPPADPVQDPALCGPGSVPVRGMVLLEEELPDAILCRRGPSRWELLPEPASRDEAGRTSRD